MRGLTPFCADPVNQRTPLVTMGLSSMGHPADEIESHWTAARRERMGLPLPSFLKIQR